MNVLDWIQRLFEQYGYFVLLLGLPVDFIALPLPPGQTTLTYTGFLAYKGVLHLGLALLSALIGSMVGVTITYAVGYKIGAPLIDRYGKWIFIKPSYLEKTKRIYNKYGNKMLLLSLFIPGVRQFFGYFTGIIRIPYRTFALYAYAGTAIWVLTFIGIGYLFGEQWQYVISIVDRYLKVIFSVLGVLLAAFLYIKWRKRRLQANNIKEHE